MTRPNKTFLIVPLVCMMIHWLIMVDTIGTSHSTLVGLYGCGILVYIALALFLTRKR